MFVSPGSKARSGKKRGFQKDVNTQINAIASVLGQVSRIFLQYTISMAVLLAGLVGMELVLSLIVTSMALPPVVLGVVTSLPAAVVQDDIITCVRTLRLCIDGDTGFGQDSIYGLFIRIIISFFRKATGVDGWQWKVPAGDTGALVYTAMSTDKKNLIDVFETVIDKRHKKIKVLVGDLQALSGSTITRMRVIFRGFRVTESLEWYITILMTLMTEIAKRKGKFDALNQFVTASNNSKILNVANFKDDELVKAEMYNLLNSLDYTDTDYHFATYIINLMNSDFKKCAW